MNVSSGLLKPQIIPLPNNPTPPEIHDTLLQKHATHLLAQDFYPFSRLTPTTTL